MSNLKDELIGAYNKAVNKRDAFLTNFKDGVADAILKGNMAEEYSDGYKAGYDFGMTIYSDLKDQGVIE